MSYGSNGCRSTEGTRAWHGEVPDLAVRLTWVLCLPRDGSGTRQYHLAIGSREEPKAVDVRLKPSTPQASLSSPSSAGASMKPARKCWIVPIRLSHTTSILLLLSGYCQDIYAPNSLWFPYR
jgi:hypothetical protein